MYEVTIDDHTQAQLDALPPEGRHGWVELRKALEIAPWNGEPLYPDTPKAC